MVAKGKQTLVYDMKKAPPEREDLIKVVLGPTGNLRAPTLKKGKTALVGFNEESYEGHL